MLVSTLRNILRQTSRWCFSAPLENHLIFWWPHWNHLIWTWFSHPTSRYDSPLLDFSSSRPRWPTTDRRVVNCLRLYASDVGYYGFAWFSQRTVQHSCPQLLQIITSLCKSSLPTCWTVITHGSGAAFFFSAFHNAQRTSQHYVAYSGRRLPCKMELRHLGHTPAVRLHPLLQMGSYRPIWWVENISVEHIFRFLQSRKYIFGSIFHLI